MADQLITGDVFMSLSTKHLRNNVFISRNMGFVYIIRAKVGEVKVQTRAEPVIKQFKLTSLGLNEPLH